MTANRRIAPLNMDGTRPSVSVILECGIGWIVLETGLFGQGVASRLIQANLGTSEGGIRRLVLNTGWFGQGVASLPISTNA